MWIKGALSACVGLLSMMLIGTGQAWSQTVLVTVCNDSSVPAYVAVVGRPSPGDNRLFISGWYTVESGGCTNTRYVAAGSFYLFAESPPLNNESPPLVLQWAGNDLTVCVDYPGPFNRLLAGTCAADNRKGFIQYQWGGGQYTWRLG
jgi:uncharacterized membrane protein